MKVATMTHFQFAIMKKEVGHDSNIHSLHSLEGSVEAGIGFWEAFTGW